MSVRWALLTPAGVASPVAVIELMGEGPDGDDLEAALARVAASCPVGSVRHAEIAGVDRGVVARPAQGRALLMPHGGPAIVRRVAQALEAAGLARSGPRSGPRSGAARGAGVPAMSASVSAALSIALSTALSIAPSPLAVDLLLSSLDASEAPDDARDRRLDHLLWPPTVALLGPPNVGKSTLLNTLAGRSAALVADRPGTTLDHVGVRIDAAGLVCDVVDTPGVRETGDEVEQDAIRRGLAQAAAADLVLVCGDAASPDPAAVVPPSVLSGVPTNRRLTVALRADLGTPAWFDGDAANMHAVSARSGRGLEALVTAVRRVFVHDDDLTSPAGWDVAAALERLGLGTSGGRR
ncbi:MAG: GTPase [Planctomycetota bacterium]